MLVQSLRSGKRIRRVRVLVYENMSFHLTISLTKGPVIAPIRLTTANNPLPVFLNTVGYNSRDINQIQYPETLPNLANKAALTRIVGLSKIISRHEIHAITYKTIENFFLPIYLSPIKHTICPGASTNPISQ